ncbi:toxin-antitoxin system antitoxin subunit [Herbiconiux moechotypicola]|uniref:Antitoxin FitA-like ribbon-helix-helix domain-containing protein n=1 Tax=Herbiconiux moechotypicola TaxID=637393 RepID=A0ABN3E6E2_9MICO|nr:toxin-antitoxin system antitoxin subunit [Herbiconiux moechotypicola]MCS5731947.1 toxin-antitoxin system antitoxin subunit [Herbiconiux moechotypicola]
MATITIRDLNDATRDKLRVRAARNGRSMEAEARSILDHAVAAEPSDDSGLGTKIRSMFAEIGFIDEVVDQIPPRATERYFEQQRASAPGAQPSP